MLYYLPGCDTNTNHSLAGKKMQEYMESKGAKIAKCCKFGVDYLKDDDILVQNCTQCDFILKERCPNIKVISLYEFVIQDKNFNWKNFNGKDIIIQDCFRTRTNDVLHNAIRTCLNKMNINYIELKENRKNTKYCGVWLNNPADSACVSVAPKSFEKFEQYREILSFEQQKIKMQEWIKQYNLKDVLVYCNGCEKGLKIGGANPIHIIELLASAY